MSPDILSYCRYSNQLIQIADDIKKCFPGASILIMAVSDRAMQEEGVRRHVFGHTDAPRTAQSGAAAWHSGTRSKPSTAVAPCRSPSNANGQRRVPPMSDTPADG
jgi:hypothetical protein